MPAPPDCVRGPLGRPSARTASFRAAGALTLALGLLGGPAGPAVGATLDDVLRAAVRGYPSIEVARANREAARFGVEQARAGHYPIVDVNGQRRLAGTALNLAQPRMRLNLYASGAIEAGVERESWREQALAATETVTREDVAFGAAQAWFRLLRAVRLQAVNERSLGRHQKLADDFAAIASIDVGRRYDLIQARSRLEQVRQLATAGEAEIAAAGEALARFYPGPVDPSALVPPAEPTAPPLLGSDDAVATHPSVETARRTLLSAEANVRAAKASRLPRLDLESTAGRDSASVLLVSWPAFDLARNAAEDAAQAALVGARAAVQEQELLVRERQRTALQAWSAAQRRERVAEGQISAATELVEVYRAQFQIGRRNLLDLLNAFAELYSAESSFEAARVDRLLAGYQMQYAVGRLAASVDGTAVPAR
jgi:adhesin transport system outer membrane protein